MASLKEILFLNLALLYSFKPLKTSLKILFKNVVEFSQGFSSKMTSSYKRWIYHYCGKPGHIRPFWYKLHGFGKIALNFRNVISMRRRVQSAGCSGEAVWRRKETKSHKKCNVAFTSVHISNFEERYFDSGCSRHMTEKSLLLTDLKESKTYQVMFGDDVKGNVIGKGNINQSGTPVLNDVKLVEGSSAKFISVSQSCD